LADTSCVSFLASLRAVDVRARRRAASLWRRFGWALAIRAATADTCGVAIDVPWMEVSQASRWKGSPANV
jgi:hypothetical protein